jgi:hypothetical protein
MKTEQIVISSGDTDIEDFSFIPDLILLFISPAFLNVDSLKIFREKYPNCIITGCSTSGEIEDINVHDNSVVATGISFDKSKVVYNEVYVPSSAESMQVGNELVEKFDQEGLKHLFVLSEGLNINGSELVKGLRHQRNQQYSITGGLAADGSSFNKTFVVTNDLGFHSNIVTGIGFYGDDLKIGHGSLGGWDSFGVDRVVTKSEGNVLFEIDGEPVLDLYKNFLGEQAKNLPASGLLFPLSMRVSASEKPVVRTILAMDEVKKSLTFAGNIPEGSLVRLMKANIDRLINAAEGAAEVSIEPIGNTHTDLAILVSCVGRRLVLKQLVEEEIEAVRDVIGEDATITGFYSYGELAPFISGTKCRLHNQTMTITTFSESDITSDT